MRLLNNVACQDDYSELATLEPDPANVLVFYTVANNPAIAQVFFPAGPRSQSQGQVSQSPEILLTTQTGSYVGATGIRFKNAVPGSVARVVAGSFTDADPKPAGVQAFLSTLSGSGGLTPPSKVTQCAARLRNSTNQSIAPGGPVQVSFDTIDILTGLSVVGNRIVIPPALGLNGAYLIGGSIQWAAGGTAGSWRELILRVTDGGAGVTLAQEQRVAYVNTQIKQTTGGLFFLDDNFTVELQANHSEAGAQNSEAPGVGTAYAPTLWVRQTAG